MAKGSLLDKQKGSYQDHPTTTGAFEQCVKDETAQSKLDDIIVEIKDNKGTSTAFSGTATTGVTNLPTVAGNVISNATIYADKKDLQVSFDNGTTYFTFLGSGSLVKNVKGNITQIQVKTVVGSIDFEILSEVNRS